MLVKDKGIVVVGDDACNGRLTKAFSVYSALIDIRSNWIGTSSVIGISSHFSSYNLHHFTTKRSSAPINVFRHHIPCSPNMCTLGYFMHIVRLRRTMIVLIQVVKFKLSWMAGSAAKVSKWQFQDTKGELRFGADCRGGWII